MLKHKYKLLLIILCIFSSQSVVAKLVANLYTIEIANVQQQTADRSKLFSEGFDKLLLKLHADPTILQDPKITAAKQQIDKYIHSFTYQDPNTNTTQLKLIFNEALVNKLLQTSGKNYLAKNRPVILLWLLLETEQGLQLLGEANYDLIATNLEYIATEYAVPIILPMLDLEEQTSITAADVAAGVGLDKFAAKYNSDLILVGKLREQNQQWYGNWSIIGANAITWELQDPKLEVQYRQLMQKLMAYLIQRNTPAGSANTFAVHDATAQQVRIKVSGINSLENYAHILEYFRNLQPVKMAKVINIASDGAVFELQVQGGAAAISNAISMEKFLEKATLLNNPVDAAALEPSGTAPLQDPAAITDPILQYQVVL